MTPPLTKGEDLVERLTKKRLVESYGENPRFVDPPAIQLEAAARIQSDADRLKAVERERDGCLREWENAYREYKAAEGKAEALVREQGEFKRRAEEAEAAADMIAVERETWKATAAEWKEAARLNMEADDCWQPRAVAAEARALASERREQAAETARRPIIDVLLDIGDRLTDEGDRIYLGSTNDADLLRSVARRLEDASAVYVRQKPTDPIT